MVFCSTSLFGVLLLPLFVISFFIAITFLLLLLLVVVFTLLQVLNCFYLNPWILPGSDLILLHIPISRGQGSEQISVQYLVAN